MTATRREDFEDEMRSRVNAILDEIFQSAGEEVREKINAGEPGAWNAGEISIKIKLEDQKEMVKALEKIAEWIKDPENWEKMEKIMLI